MKYEVLNGKDMQLSIATDGFHAYQIEADGKLRLQITVDKHINASVFITYHGVDIACDCTLIMEEGSTCHLLFWNEALQTFDLQQQIMLYRDAQLFIGYGDVNAARLSSNITAQLLEEGAGVHLLSACVSAEKKHYEMNCLHQATHTSSQMENYSVVKQDGDYFMQANGKIDKGAYQSSSLQATRVLTMSKQQRSEVIPLLLIDENDVKAGHATTVGQPDENQLYYLQTRGLSREQALSLLIIGYMMPILTVIDHDELRQQLQSDIEKKVGYHA